MAQIQAMDLPATWDADQRSQVMQVRTKTQLLDQSAGLHMCRQQGNGAHIECIAVATQRQGASAGLRCCLKNPPMATPNCSTYGRSNCSRQDGRMVTIRAWW